MADEKLKASVTDNTLNINIKSSNADSGSMQPVMSINEALKTNNQQKQIKEAKKVDPVDLNKKKTEVKKDNKEEQGSKELEILLEISQTLSSLKDATINFKTETFSSLKDITEQADKKDDGKMFSSYLSEGFIESLQDRIAQRNLSEAISNAVETSFIDNISDEFLEKMKISLNEVIDESTYFINQNEKTSNHSLLLEQNVASLKLINDFLRETQNFVDNKGNPGEKTEKFEAMVEDNSKRNAEALQTNLPDEQVNQLNIDLKEHWQQETELKEKTKETLERLEEDINNSEEVVSDDKVSKEVEEIDSKIDQDITSNFKNGKEDQESIEETENDTTDVVLEELKEKFQVNVDEIEGIEELLKEKFSEDKNNAESKSQAKAQMLKILENRLSNPPKQNLPAKEQQNTLVKKPDSNKPKEALTESKISSMLSGKSGVNAEKNDLGKKQITDKSSIKTLSSKTDSSEKVNKVEIVNFKDNINNGAKTPQIATASGMNKQQQTFISDKQQNSMEKLVSDMKNVNMKSSQERVSVSGGKKHGASIVSLLSGITGIVGSFLNVFKKNADEQRAAAAFKEKFGNKEKKDKFNISIKNKQTTKKENKSPEKKEGKSIWGWLIGLALGGLWAVTKFLGKGVLKALWSVTKLALKGIGKALLWLGKLLAKGLWKVLKWAGKLLWKGISKLGSLIGKVFGKMGGVIKRVVPKLFKSFMSVMNKILGPIGKFFGKFLGKAFSIFKGIFSKILGPIAKWIGKLISKLFGGMGGKLGDLGGKLFDKVGGKIFKKGGGLFKKVGGKAFGKVGKLGGKLLSKGGGKVAAKAAGKVAAKVAGKAALRAGAGALKAIPGVGLLATAGMAAFDAVDGWKNAASITGKAEKDLTTGDRAKAAGASVLSGLTFGLVSSQTMYKGINAVTGGASKLFKKVGGGIGKLWKKAGGLGGIAKKAVKYSPIGLAATGAKKLFGWMTGSKKKEEAEKKKKSLEQSMMMGRAITRFTPIVRLLKQIISLMGGETNEMKLLFGQKENSLASNKISNKNTLNNAKKINAASVQIETSKINSNVNENTVKPLGENVKNLQANINKPDLKKQENGKAVNPQNDPKRYDLFLRLLKPVITEAISDYFAFGAFNIGKSYFNAAKGLFGRDSTDEASKM